MKLKNVHVLLFTVILLSSCTQSQQTQMAGLWVVEKVTAGEKEMTPAARWVRFNKDMTQQSGNGWYQHSVGTWTYNSDSNELKVTNINGYIDNYPAFKVRIENNRMFWNRIEDGQAVEVTLKRTDSLPPSHIDELLGVWDLVKVTENGNDITQQYDPENKWYIYYRWDKVFIIQHTPEGKLSGIYNANGHRPELEMIYDRTDCKREKWTYSASQDSLILTSNNSEKEVCLSYKRIHYFPE